MRSVAIVLLLCGAAQAQPYSAVDSTASVIRNPSIVAVYWGSQSSGVISAMNTFYADITASEYLDWLSEYSLPGKTIGRGSFAGSFNLARPTGTYTTVDIAREIDWQIMNGTLPFPTEDTIYAVHFGPGHVAMMGATLYGIPVGTTQGHCAYHFTARTQAPIAPPLWGFGPKLRIMVLPDPVANGCASSPTPLMFAASAAHEVIESITDPDAVVLGMYPLWGESLTCGMGVPIGTTAPVPVLPGPPEFAVPQAWVSAAIPPGSFYHPCGPNEVVDECGSGGSAPSASNVLYSVASRNYTLQRAYSERAGRCISSGMMGTATYVDGTFSGWAADPDARAAGVTIEILVDGSTQLSTVANLANAEVNTATGLPGAHGFDAVLPLQYWGGLPHDFAVVAKSVLPGNDRVLLTGQLAQTGYPAWLSAMPLWF